ncbi:hypothetical protein AV654_32690 [Paenibacillus elgii]|uniref:DNA mimic protein DMP19 C-terminal domain-containing protein n=1 Tax=Paenibacillus elgii TaxID=189691 RepID=A0A163UH89_9BACL|nr:DUF4375 domain-containing protein [Paenibacillus elgii]KZE73326.1 hypothetical protein AV654_32690 [Paenibacillus elgii]
MEIYQTILRRLLPDDKELINASADEIMDHVASNRYRQENIQLKDEEVFFKLPALLRDIVLLIDFDTELNMNGILGFLENSTGKYLNETIEALERIGAVCDADAMKAIKRILENYNLSTGKLHRDLQDLEPYEINHFRQVHAIADDEFFEEIQHAADKLSTYSQEENIFDHLLTYIEANKRSFVEDVQAMLSEK